MSQTRPDPPKGSNAEEVTEPVLLVLDTSGDLCGVAVLRGERLLVTLTFQHRMHLSERLMSHIDQTLTAADCSLDSVDIFVAGTGPGSFTGVRIGVMTAKTLAEVQGKPLIGINALEAIAAEYIGLNGFHVVPILPCRRGEFYACAYRVEGDLLRPLCEPGVFSATSLTALLTTFPPAPLLLCGSAVATYRALQAETGEGVPLLTAAFVGKADHPRPEILGKLALRQFRSGQGESASLAVLPLYLAPPSISEPKKKISGNVPSS